jgi:hypothetical protein
VDPREPSGECGCFVPPPCGQIDVGGRPVCFGSCAGGPGQAFCLFDPESGCICTDSNDVCQPNGGVCGGLCPGGDESCVVADDLPPGLFGCRCDPDD